MEVTRSKKSIALNSRELRVIARTAHRRNYNRNMTPAQFKLLDPRGTHILMPFLMHERADGEPVDPHVRCHAWIKLIGKDPAIELMMDVPLESFGDLLQYLPRVPWPNMDLVEKADSVISKAIEYGMLPEDTEIPDSAEARQKIASDVVEFCIDVHQNDGITSSYINPVVALAGEQIEEILAIVGISDVDLSTVKEGNEATPNADNMRVEGKA